MNSFFSDLLGSLFDSRQLGLGVDDNRPMQKLCNELLSVHGEVTGAKNAHTILNRYRQMGDEGKRAFFHYLANELDVDPAEVVEAAKAYGKQPTRARFKTLMQVSEPRRQELLRRLNKVPGGTAELVQMRVDLLRMMENEPGFDRTDLDFKHMFVAWFNRGFLVMRRISWETPANILEKIIEYEAVHAINDWDDLRRRMQPPDRRCYAFFHPAMPEEPLIFVEVALMKGIPHSIQTILSGDRKNLSPLEANTAVFYSISNCQSGLKGISFGNSLIKQVVTDLQAEVKTLKTFVTLSPLPLFGRWLNDKKEDSELGELATHVLNLAASRDPENPLQKDDAQIIRMLVTYYLLEEKRPDESPLDPVARFHLGNGAFLYDVHADADISANGLKTACGAMVNYLYDLDQLAVNHESFVNDKKVTVSRSVRALERALERSLSKRPREQVTEHA